MSDILQRKPHPEQGYRACLGMMRLGRDYGHERMEAACCRALALDACSYRSIRSILKTKPGCDRQRRPLRHRLLVAWTVAINYGIRSQLTTIVQLRIRPARR